MARKQQLPRESVSVVRATRATLGASGRQVFPQLSCVAQRCGFPAESRMVLQRSRDVIVHRQSSTAGANSSQGVEASRAVGPSSPKDRKD
jgi:hypothetical protein